MSCGSFQKLISFNIEDPKADENKWSTIRDNLFFDQVDRSLPMIHKARYQAMMSLAPHMRPPACLRYAMWALAAGISDRFDQYQAHFYQRARKYLELDEMRGFGQAILTLSHCQAWMLVSMYEFKNMYFPRAWMSTGRAVRLTQMLGLHRLDGTGLDVKMTIPPPRDWTEREERRRTFWLVFWGDRCASIGTGWPMSFEEKDVSFASCAHTIFEKLGGSGAFAKTLPRQILTNLPGSNESFQNSQPVKTVSLNEALQSVDQDLSSFSGCVLMATLFGRNLTHLHRPEPDDREDDLNGKFWQRHRSIDAILLNIKLGLPDHLRLPLGMQDPNVVFLNMCLHSSAICLHQAAIFKAEKHRLPANVAGESKMRCIAAASEIATIMRTVSHMDLRAMNPFTAFCLYVAARVFVQFLRARPSEQQVTSSLSFLLTAMHAISRKNPLTESFIAQLELDMDSAGVKNPSNKSGLERLMKRGIVCDHLNPVSVYDVRDEVLLTRSSSPSIPTQRCRPAAASRKASHGRNASTSRQMPPETTIQTRGMPPTAESSVASWAPARLLNLPTQPISQSTPSSAKSATLPMAGRCTLTKRVFYSRTRPGPRRPSRARTRTPWTSRLTRAATASPPRRPLPIRLSRQRPHTPTTGPGRSRDIRTPDTRRRDRTCSYRSNSNSNSRPRHRVRPTWAIRHTTPTSPSRREFFRQKSRTLRRGR